MCGLRAPAVGLGFEGLVKPMVGPGTLWHTGQRCDIQ